MKITCNNIFNNRDDVLNYFFQVLPPKPHQCGYDLPDEDYDLWFPNIGSSDGKWHNNFLSEDQKLLQEICDEKKLNTGTRKRYRFVFGYYKEQKQLYFLGIYQSMDTKPDGTPINHYIDGFWYRRVGVVLEDTDKYKYWKEPSFFDVLEKLIKKHLGENKSDTDIANALGISKQSFFNYRKVGQIPQENTVKKIASRLNLTKEEEAKLFHAAGLYK